MELQQADREILRLNQEVAALPKRVAAIEEKLAGTKAVLEQARAAVKADEATRRKYESAIQDQQGKISKYRDQSLAVKRSAASWRLGRGRAARRGWRGRWTRWGVRRGFSSADHTGALGVARGGHRAGGAAGGRAGGDGRGPAGRWGMALHRAGEGPGGDRGRAGGALAAYRRARGVRGGWPRQGGRGARRPSPTRRHGRFDRHPAGAGRRPVRGAGRVSQGTEIAGPWPPVPAIPEYRRGLAASHNGVGLLLEERGDNAGAMAEQRKCQGLMRALAAEHPDIPDTAATWPSATTGSAACWKRAATWPGPGRAAEVPGDLPGAGRRAPRRPQLPPQAGRQP